MDFTNKTAISTGAASGMGLLFSENFTSLGGNVVMADVNEAVLNEKVAAINARGCGKAIGVICDVRDTIRYVRFGTWLFPSSAVSTLWQILREAQQHACAVLSARSTPNSPMFR